MLNYKNVLIRSSLSRQVYQHLKQAIILQEDPNFKMGEKINESDIAKMYNCSVTPVRESINMLRRDGLIVGDSYQSSSIVSFNAQDVEDIFDVRKFLEVGALRKAFDLITPQDLDQLSQAQDQYRQAYEVFDEYQIIQHNHTFHNTLISRSGNRVLAQQLDSISELVAMARAPIAQKRKARGASANLFLPVQEHERIYTAIKQKDLPEAELALSAHIDRIKHDSCAYYMSLFGEGKIE